MFSSVIRRIFERSRNQVSKPDCEAILLLGNEDAKITVIGVSSHKALLRELLPSAPEPGDRIPFLAQLRCDRLDGEGIPKIEVFIEGRKVGMCPANLSTQLCEWLKKWNFVDVPTFCNASIEIPKYSDKQDVGYSVSLCLTLPFKMTRLA